MTVATITSISRPRPWPQGLHRCLDDIFGKNGQDTINNH